VHEAVALLSETGAAALRVGDGTVALGPLLAAFGQSLG
jgi:hypothetical protein